MFGFRITVANSTTCQEPKLAIVAMRSGGRVFMKEGTCAGHILSGPNCKWRYKCFLCRQSHMLSVLGSAITITRTLAYRIVYQDLDFSVERGAKRSHMGPNPSRVFSQDIAHGLSKAFQQNQASGPMDVQSQLEQLLTKAPSQHFQHQTSFK